MRFRSRKDHSVMGTSNLPLSLEEKIKAMQQHQKHSIEDKNVSIYRVPEKLRKVEPGAYDPHFISIGPYHYGSPKLQDSESIKLQSLKKLVGSEEQSGNELNKLTAALREIEHQARGYYSEDVKLSKDEFVEMMLLDGCFIIELFRDLNKKGFASSSLLSKRWMLPVVRRDLITLENQLPMIVLKTLFEKTSSKSIQEPSLEALALHFFDPLMPRASQMLKQVIASATEPSSAEGQQCRFKHLLDLFHSSISLGKVKRCKEPHMYRSVSELKEAGMKIRILRGTQPLELTFRKGVLRIPCLQIDNHTGSFFRNIVAYEQSHSDCEPDLTTYLFFIAKLINTAGDVGLLHYEEVIQHSLGSNKQVADLVNSLFIEVEHDRQDSYLCDVVKEINSYCDRPWIKAKARLKHEYFSNVWVGVSTIAGLLLLYLTLLQTTCDVINAHGNEKGGEVGWWGSFNSFLAHPVKTSFGKVSGMARDIFRDSSVGLGDIIGSASCMAGDFIDPSALWREIFGSASHSIPFDTAPKDPPSGGP